MHYSPKQAISEIRYSLLYNIYCNYSGNSIICITIRKFIKINYIPGRGVVGLKVNVKPLGKSQTFSAMIGYVTKDFDKPHYSVVSKGVSAQITNK